MSNLFLLISLLSLLMFHCLIITSEIFPFCYGQGGEWHLLQPSVGISAMHMQLLPNNKVVAFDRTDFGPSNLSLPEGRCRYDAYDTALKVDCTAHSILYDVETNSFRPLMVQTDTWCSSGAMSPNGSLIQTGGFNDGDRAVRVFTPCDANSCDWVEYPGYLSQRRWYATNQILPDGRIIIIGGRREFNYEFYPKNEDPYSTSSGPFWLRFLLETRDESENNLYPFVHLLPDGNLFVFANTRSISLDYNHNRVVKEFPPIPVSDPRNYPSSGSSVLLPIDENMAIEAEIVICGGAPRGAYTQAGRGNFVRASSSCGRLRVSDENPRWVMEDMPIARVMGDMLLLPTGDVIIVNGVECGTAGWELGQSPVTRPVIYRPNGSLDWRFSVMSASPRPRLYHSTAILLADGRVLVGGSNPHRYYNFTDVDYPTDLSLEAFSPPYLSVEHRPFQPQISSVNEILMLGQPFSLTFWVPLYLSDDVLSVRIVAPSFTTHSLAMNQRMVVLKLVRVSHLPPDSHNLNVVGPSTAEIAPPGYYMLFVVHAGIPSWGSWVKIQ